MQESDRLQSSQCDIMWREARGWQDNGCCPKVTLPEMRQIRRFNRLNPPYPPYRLTLTHLYRP